MSYLLCCVFILVFLRIVYAILPVSLDCPFVFAPSVFSNVYIVYDKILVLKLDRDAPYIRLVRI